MRNIAMFERIAQQIQEHPETHDQAMWEERDAECGTTRCVAGWALYFWGLDHGFSPDTELWKLKLAYVEATGVEESYVDIGADILGLEVDEAAYLFNGSTDDGDAYDLVVAYAEGRR